MIPVSKETAAVRGIAKKGPMVSAQRMVTILPYIGETGSAIISGLSKRLIAIAKIPSKGKPTPLKQKPKVAISRLSPACCPSTGGKIKLPAPKKKEKSIKPMGIIKERESLGCSIYYTSFILKLLPIEKCNGGNELRRPQLQICSRGIYAGLLQAVFQASFY